MAANDRAELPTGIEMALLVSTSIRVTVLLSWLLTQTWSSSTTTDDGPSSTTMRCTRPVAREMREMD